MKETNSLVCVLLSENVHLFELGIATEVFGLSRPEFNHWYDFKIIATNDDVQKAIGGLVLKAEYNLDALKQASLILIPGWSSEAPTVSKEIKQLLIEAADNGCRFASICSGVFLLAELGFLNGKSATTHWRYTDKLQKLYPSVNVNPNVLYVDEGQFLTSAGSAAGIDLCLHLVRQDFGHEKANIVARRLVLPAHREGGQAQFIPRPIPKERGGHISSLLDEIRLKLNQEWTVETMADRAGLSKRTLLRRFKETIGEKPHSWLTSERIERAKELLEVTELSIAEIAEASGLVTPETLRHHFRQKVGVSPTRYRQEFHRKE
ncbi:helix-turn-helix domain-containing protein [Curvivirga aplysinae]|uniref:helix-turn-helix domain-containing protein n=1 Tax=Curvivirga aplysinae TaxID=2529852 RepID=UPI0012BC9D00|nr:helix-turn-helix domain-containing protein [Curvivirga aplysinae]MTI08234.1 helix-turn-helix domain-containing protein [Curvivirga aplysinae]